MTYPLTFRRHVLKIQHQEALTFKATAHRFGIGIASLVRWHHSLEPKGRPQQSYKIDMEALKKDVITSPDDYLYERAARFHVTPTGIYLALRRMGITYKKNPLSSQTQSRGSYHFSGNHSTTKNLWQTDSVS